MTISSVLVGAVAGDPRQTQSTLSADALQAGAWSAIDWEFDSVLQALLPEGKDEMPVSAVDEEKGIPADAPAIPVNLASTAAVLPNASPVALSLDLPVEATVKSPEQSVETSSVPPPPPMQTPPTMRVVPRILPPLDISLIKDAPGLRLVRTAAPKPGAAVIQTLTVPVTDSLPLTTLPALPQDTSVDSHPCESKVDAGNLRNEPALDSAQIAPSRTFHFIAKISPGLLAGSRTTVLENGAGLIKQIVTDISAAQTTVATVPGVLAQAGTATRLVDRGSELVSVLVPAKGNDSEVHTAVSVSTGAGSDLAAVPAKIDSPEVLPTVPTQATSLIELPVTAPVNDSDLADSNGSQVRPAMIHAPVEMPPVRQPVEDHQRQYNPESLSPIAEPQFTALRSTGEEKPTKSRDEEIDIETVLRQGQDSPEQSPAPALTAVTAQPTQAPALTDVAPAPAQSPASAIQILRTALASTLSPSAVDSEKRPEDRPNSHPGELISIQQTKPAPSPTPESRDLPTSPITAKADTERFFVQETKSRGDQLSSNDSEIAFAGRLIPKSPTGETHPDAPKPVERSTQPESVDTKPERTAGPVAQEIQEVSADHQVRPLPEADHSAMFSPIHRDTAPATASRATDAVPTARAASSEIIQEPLHRESTGPVREISMRFNDQTQESAHLRVVEKSGEVLVSVRSGSEQLARTLSSDLGELTHRLEQSGFQAELYRPGASGSSGEPGHDRRENSSTADHQTSQSWSRERRDSQQHPGQKPHEWIDDLDESMGLS